MRMPFVAAIIGATLALSGCHTQAVTTTAAVVPSALVPTQLDNRHYVVLENTSPKTRRALSDPGPDALIDNGRIWEVRQNGRLTAALEIAAVKPDVDLAKKSVRDQFTQPILVGLTEDVRIAGVEVFTATTAGGETVLVWFGQHLFEVMQVKGDQTLATRLAQDLITYQRTQKAWIPLPELYQ